MARMLAIATAVLLLLPSDAVAGGWTWPVRGSVVAAYDYRGATPYSGGQHRGIDIAAAPGTPVVAAAAGTVRFVGTAGSSGLTASIRTADGRHDTSYLHLSSVAVGGGEAVAAGERIGSAGTSGSPSSSTPHLHFGVRLAGSRHAYRDPLSLLAPPTAFRDGPRGVPVAVPAPIRVAPGRAPAPRPAPAARRAPWRVPRLGVAPAPEPRVGATPSRWAPMPARRPPATGGLDAARTIAGAALLAAALLGGSRPAARRRARGLLRLRPSAQGAE